MHLSAAKYKAKVFWPLNVLAIVYLVAYLVNNFHLDIANRHHFLFSSVDNIVWAIFALDFLINYVLAPTKKHFLRKNFLDFVLVIFPFIRILRLLRLTSLLTKQLSGLKAKIYVSVPVYTGSAAALLVLLGGATIFDIESTKVGSNIKTPSDALWWAAVTISTVGYGDRYPISDQGRLLGVGLMVCGIAVVGTVTASFAGWLISQIREVETENANLEIKLVEIKEILDKHLKKK